MLIWLVLLYFIFSLGPTVSLSGLESTMQNKMALNRELLASVHHKALHGSEGTEPTLSLERSRLINGWLWSHLHQCPLGPALTNPLKSPFLQGSAQPAPFGAGDFLRTNHLGPLGVFVEGVMTPKSQLKTMKGVEVT